jgi:hypothetical protein
VLEKIMLLKNMLSSEYGGTTGDVGFFFFEHPFHFDFESHRKVSSLRKWQKGWTYRRE